MSPYHHNSQEHITLKQHHTVHQNNEKTLHEMDMTSTAQTRPRYFAIVLAAGSGKRFAVHQSSTSACIDSLPKQYQTVAGKTVLQHSIQRLCAAVLPAECVVVHSEGDEQVKRQHLSWPVSYVVGGQERMHSVMNALESLTQLSDPADPDDFVVIHDAARPCIQKHDVLNLISQTKNHPVGGILAVPVSATLKKSTEFLIQETVPREHLWMAQTPQVLRFGLLKEALATAIADGAMVTDDASALEMQGHQPLIVRGSVSNLKITYADDLKLAEFYLLQ